MKGHLARVFAGLPLSEEQAAEVMGLIMDGDATPAQIGALLAALAVRGESEDELVGFARAMRERALPLRSAGAVDTCGTGGDGAATFNVSTVASLAVAACGVPVAKHGNRSASGSCGSADLLEGLGLRLEAPLESVQRAFDEAGWTFLFAPAFHAATRHAAGPRREIGLRTAFNLLGPLTNPARPAAQLVGVPRPELTEPLARCLGRLGVERAWVVHGAGLDELSPCGPSRVSALAAGRVASFEVRPGDAGLEPCRPEELRAPDREACLAVARHVLAGGRGPARDAVCLNAGAALLVAGRATSLRDGTRMAAEALDGGRAGAVLARAREVFA